MKSEFQFSPYTFIFLTVTSPFNIFFIQISPFTQSSSSFYSFQVFQVAYNSSSDSVARRSVDGVIHLVTQHPEANAVKKNEVKAMNKQLRGAINKQLHDVKRDSIIKANRCVGTPNDREKKNVSAMPLACSSVCELRCTTPHVPEPGLT